MKIELTELEKEILLHMILNGDEKTLKLIEDEFVKELKKKDVKY